MIIDTSAIVAILKGGPDAAAFAEARRAYWDYGRGSGHKAGLNYGNCFSYALARDCHEPLLFKGDDFVHTDVTPVL
ncbi:type II toxin-antitoxin system VapC family toxin [Nonomuraea jabiensis]|uniref:Uncharacterized protein with PIN domain n=1 Tax=Nonomuraea jabiensis TaxID=882448 RepID=A0A7W9LCR6_9ACTN|nr:type II toxin-antitoxin system VapC family toxin [Nonomuraea jabiensis]MBB5779009.1 uncharacterized protein with PIN domain [Nonomuraea jabiensis]